jgi:hypothetical protein
MKRATNGAPCHQSLPPCARGRTPAAPAL